MDTKAINEHVDGFSQSITKIKVRLEEISTERVNLQASLKKYEGALEYATILLGNTGDTETAEGVNVVEKDAETAENTNKTGGNSETVVMNDSVSTESVLTESVSADAESAESSENVSNVGGKKLKKRNKK